MPLAAPAPAAWRKGSRHVGPAPFFSGVTTVAYSPILACVECIAAGSAGRADGAFATRVSVARPRLPAAAPPPADQKKRIALPSSFRHAARHAHLALALVAAIFGVVVGIAIIVVSRGASAPAARHPVGGGGGVLERLGEAVWFCEGEREGEERRGE